MRPRSSAPRRTLPGSPFNAPQVEVVVESYEVGDRVNHDRHGLGRVVAVESAGIVVDFGAGAMRLAVPNPKLTRL